MAKDGALGLENTFCRLKKAFFRILFLRCELWLFLFFSGEGEGWPRPPCIQSEAVFPKLRLTEIAILVSESSGGVQNSGLDWWYLLIPSFGSHSSVVGMRMSTQIASLDRRLITLVAFVWFYYRVSLQMFLQITSPNRGIVTLIVSMWILQS